MSSNQATADYILEQITGAGQVSLRKMFGEYAFYCDGKVVALLCDDQLFVKPTVNGGVYIGNVEKAPPYPGAKPHFLISGDRWEDRDWLNELVKMTALELPMPKPKKPKTTKVP